jgi:hypothetical protein
MLLINMKRIKIISLWSRSDNCSINKCKKAQSNSLDMIIALIIFAVIFVSVSSMWDSVRSGFGNIEKRNDLEALSRYGMESLLGSSGSPQNWHNLSSINASNQASLGLVSPHYGIVSQDKISALIRMNASSYPAYKEILGIRGADYEFLLNITQYDQNYQLIGSELVGYTGQCENVIKVHRAALTDMGNFVFFNFYGCRI